VPRTRNLLRRTWRSPAVRAWRPLTHSTVRSLSGCRRRPNDLSQALTAFQRAIRCHHRLAKLAPSFFDSAVVDRETRERNERRRWMESWQPLLDKVYGPSRDSDPQPSMVPDYSPPLPGPRTRRAVERELAGWNFWMAIGRLAMARHHQRYPHALPSLSQLARLLQIAFDFSGLACGLEPRRPASPASYNVPDFGEADQALARAYGNSTSSGNGRESSTSGSGVMTTRTNAPSEIGAKESA